MRIVNVFVFLAVTSSTCCIFDPSATNRMKVILVLLLLTSFSCALRIISNQLRFPFISSRRETTFCIHARRAGNLPDLSQSAFPDPPEEGYDLVVLGSGPGGESVAIHAAKLGAKVAVIERKAAFGGPTGLTSKAVREATKRICSAVEQVGGDRRRQIAKLYKRRFPVLKTAAEAWQANESREKLKNYGCDLYIGKAELQPSFEKGITKTLVRVCRPSACVDLMAFHVCIATGSRAHRPSELSAGVPLIFEKGLVIDSTEMSSITDLPKSVVVYGGGVIAVEYATVFAELGVGVTIVCEENSLLPFVEEDIRRGLVSRMRKNHVLIVHQRIQNVYVERSENATSVKVAMEMDPKRPTLQRVFTADLFIYSGGRDANSEDIGLDNLNIKTSKFGRIVIDDNFRTTSENSVYAVGDVIGPPGLASAAQQQGRFVADRLFSSFRSSLTPGSADYSEWLQTTGKPPEILFGNSFGSTTIDSPMTLWTIPEVASVGMTTKKALDLNAGKVLEGFGYFKHSARGKLSGENDGFLKIVAKFSVERGDYVIVGVHIFGEGANELIQLGSILVHGKTTLKTVSNTPFSAVTLSGLYQTACEDALNKAESS